MTSDPEHLLATAELSVTGTDGCTFRVHVTATPPTAEPEPDRELVDVVTRDVLTHYGRRYAGKLTADTAGMLAVNDVRRAYGLRDLTPTDVSWA